MQYFSFCKLQEVVNDIDNQQSSIEILNLVLSDLVKSPTSLEDTKCDLFLLYTRWCNLKQRASVVGSSVEDGAAKYGVYNTLLADIKEWLDHAEKSLHHTMEPCDSLQDAEEKRQQTEARNF